MIKKKYNKAGNKCTVTFSIAPDQTGGATRAHLVGDFNNWDRESQPMARSADGGFELSLQLEPGHEFLFRYLFDGTRWENDWNADKYVPSPYADTENSVVIV